MLPFGSINYARERRPTQSPPAFPPLFTFKAARLVPDSRLTPSNPSILPQSYVNSTKRRGLSAASARRYSRRLNLETSTSSHEVPTAEAPYIGRINQ